MGGGCVGRVKASASDEAPRARRLADFSHPRDSSPRRRRFQGSLSRIIHRGGRVFLVCCVTSPLHALAGSSDPLVCRHSVARTRSRMDVSGMSFFSVRTVPLPIGGRELYSFSRAPLNEDAIYIRRRTSSDGAFCACCFASSSRSTAPSPKTTYRINSPSTSSTSSIDTRKKVCIAMVLFF